MFSQRNHPYCELLSKLETKKRREMSKKKILGLDLGTNSIGWALIENDFAARQGAILGMGSRIIPMSQDQLSDFEKGNTVSQTAERTRLRSVRRLRERFLLRRERLHRVLNIIGFLPLHYASKIDFENRTGKFKDQSEPKIAYDKDGFLFKNSFVEMLADFKKHRPELLTNSKGEATSIPYDWTIYFLRKKALTQRIEKEELAWILLNFNQKRGYYQLRGEEEEGTPNKLIEYHSLKVTDVSADDPVPGKTERWYSVTLENGWVYRRSSRQPLNDWIGKTKDFIVSTDLNEDGTPKTDKEGNVKRSFRAPADTDWTLMKKRTEKDISSSGKTVGAYIYDALLNEPQQKIRGRLVRTIERVFYKDELQRILAIQQQFHPELNDSALLAAAAQELYRQNEAHQQQLARKSFAHLFIDDIIFYQRPLKSKKDTIARCPLEARRVRTPLGEIETIGINVIHKSHPLFQEFRLWQWLQNLSIYLAEDDSNVTPLFLADQTDIEATFDFLNNRKDIEQNQLIEFLLRRRNNNKKPAKAEVTKYRWNYVTDKTYPCNEPRYLLATRLQKVDALPDGFLTHEVELHLWHLIYSVTDKVQFEKALTKFALRYQLPVESFVEAFKNTVPFKSEYGAYSEKAIKKLLPLMRVGKYWSWDAIDAATRLRIDKLLTGEFDKTIQDRVRDKAINLNAPASYQGLPLWLAQYVVYNRHSEAADTAKWKTADEMGTFLDARQPGGFKQHSLRNPIVEQIITETLRVVKDIWHQFGAGQAGFFDEIHIELGREMKNTKADRKAITDKMSENENTNLRMKALLTELAQDPSVSNVRPYSPSQQELLKLYEEGALSAATEITDDILKISKTAQPSSADLRRYKLWLEQKYRSPYTGEVIPLSRLFTPDYQIEHIIPQSRYFDDSMTNKVICEAAVNSLKDNCLGFEFIKKFRSTIVDCGQGRKVKILEPEAYEDLVKQSYTNNRGKRQRLLLEEIPDKMIERQLNDSRYISRYVSMLLSKIVRSETNDDGVNSKNLIACNGKITSELKQDWGLNDVWNDLILPRFERLNKLMNTEQFTTWNESYQKYIPTVPLELSKGFSKKRIDHRHHAMDALVIACATRDHVNLLNNQAAKSEKSRHDLKRKLMSFEKVQYRHPHTGEVIVREVPKAFEKPWEHFTADARQSLAAIVVSFKQNLRVINKATNYYETWVTRDGEKKKERVRQAGLNWAIRKSMHKDTVSGKVNLPWVKVPKDKIITATRKALDTSFDQAALRSITDTGIQKILSRYLSAKGNNPELAFSPEGIEELNQRMREFNEGRSHQPIRKVRVFEVGSKFALGYSSNKPAKYVEADKGTNLFFAVYQNEQGKRSFASVPLNEVIERMKQGLAPVAEVNEKGDRLTFYLSPNDLVYVPSEGENQGHFNGFQVGDNPQEIYQIYRVVSFTGSQIFFISHSVASPVVNKLEFSTLNKMERSLNGVMIKDRCLKLIVTRIGGLKIS